MINLRALVIVFLLISLFGWSQEKEKKKYFLNGKPIGTIYADVYSGINQGENPTGFEIRRAYLGYQFDLDEDFSAKLVLDIGSPNDASDYLLEKRFAYFKYAFVQYKKGKFTTRFGIIPTALFKVQEKVWGHRYIAKTVTDAQRMGSSADLGVSLNYEAFKSLSFDLSVLNGEGYSNIQNDNSYKLGLGVTAKPWKGLTLRMYGDIIEKGASQISWVNFIAYNWKNKIIAGFEYAKQYNYKNVANQDLTVWSAYVSYNMTKKWQLFGRFDQVTSNVIESYFDPWHFARDGSYALGGVQFIPHKKVKLAVNYKAWLPPSSDFKNEQFIYLNLEFKI